MRLGLVDAAAPRVSVPMEMDPRSSGFTGSGQDLRVGRGQLSTLQICRVRAYDTSDPPNAMLTMSP
jgi:hypothetical protein